MRQPYVQPDPSHALPYQMTGCRREDIVKPLQSNSIEDMERNLQMLIQWIKANTTDQ